MRVAFYAPLKPPDHPVPSGDRRTAQLLFEALHLAGHEPLLASRLRSFDGAGDPERQARMARMGEMMAARLLRRWRSRPGDTPDLWFTYHLYHKAPDHLGPAISATLSIPYVVAEASLAPKQAGGLWDIGHRAVEAALRQAEAVVGLNPADRDCVLPVIAGLGHWESMPPFLDARRYSSADRPSNTPLRLIAVAMMRPGDKLASYRILGIALSTLLDLPWSLDVIGDGPARSEVARALAPLGARVRYLGALDPDAVPAALASADLFVWPAVNEAFCMALLEAQAASLPAVVGASGGVGTIVADGETGALVASGDAIAFAAAIRGLLRDEGARVAMGRAARAKILREHDLPAAAARLRAVIEGLGRARAA